MAEACGWLGWGAAGLRALCLQRHQHLVHVGAAGGWGIASGGNMRVLFRSMLVYEMHAAAVLEACPAAHADTACRARLPRTARPPTQAQAPRQ